MSTTEDLTGTRKPTNAKDRIATNRLNMSLFPDSAIAYGALALAEGDLKYGAGNYRVEGVLLSVYMGALMRHAAKFMAGEWADEKTHVPHLGSMLASLAVIIDAHTSRFLRDDRLVAQPGMIELLSEFEGIMAHLRDVFPNPPERFTQARRVQERDAYYPDVAAVLDGVYALPETPSFCLDPQRSATFARETERANKFWRPAPRRA